MIDELREKPLFLSRRHFLKTTACSALLWSFWGFSPPAFAQRGKKGLIESRLSPHFQPLKDGKIQCQLCPRECIVPKGGRGFCGVRENREGKYYSLVYGNPCAVHVDPVEKKPFYHLLPASTSFSIATAGCNFRCKFCQNWEISQVRSEQVDHFDLPPEAAAVRAAEALCRSIAYTYTEPTVFFEYMHDTAVRAKLKGVRNVVVTGGHINPEPLSDLLSVVDAIKIDLKGFSQEFYATYVRGELKPVLEAIRAVAKSKVWLEIVYLVIPTLNDRMDVIKEMARWVKNEAGDHVPVHFSRFHPMYLIKNLPPTPLSTLESARRTALEEGLRFVYLGNVPGHEGESTYCPGCGNVAIKRVGYSIEALRLKKGKCEKCGTPIPGIWA
jgi:pyruvate formate lyase activating enzyme